MNSDLLKIFISYTKKDLRWAEWVAWHLEDHGHDVVIQAWDFTPGKNFLLEMDRATLECDCTLAASSRQLSPHQVDEDAAVD